MPGHDRSDIHLIADYLRLVGDQKHSWFMYRGHACSDWEARPSIERAGAKGIANYPTLRTFTQFARPFVSILPQTDLEWLVLAQHQGIPTPLLDWTLNPLVALYFACLEPADRDGSVLSLHFNSMYRLEHTLYVNPFEAGNEFEGFALLSGKGLNARSTAQNSVMTLHRASKDAPRGPTSYLEVVHELIRVPASMKASYRRGLLALGLDAAVLFADLQTSVAAFKELLAEASTDMIVSVP